MMKARFLTEIANYTNTKIAKVILNDTVEIADFTIKQVTESTIGMQYMIPSSQISLVTKIELADASGRVISSNEVYVPIASDTLLLHTIQVKEAAS
ncbi:ketopantoate hydroxymethyltransferase [Paenibacillus sp. M1]|uniref:Ketopantoate hydroxymethyltransferase n=1 Tax=Paenibacillus haidiansis TaxID=1574488 RepID=A0ABU7VMC8_9BACL